MTFSSFFEIDHMDRLPVSISIPIFTKWVSLCDVSNAEIAFSARKIAKQFFVKMVTQPGFTLVGMNNKVSQMGECCFISWIVSRKIKLKKKYFTQKHQLLNELQCTQLRKLTISTKFLDTSQSCLTSFMIRCGALEEVELDSSISAISRTSNLACIPSWVTKVICKDVVVTQDMLMLILKNCSVNLRVLDAGNPGTGGSKFASIISTCPKLEVLNISYCDVAGDSLSVLGEKCPRLKELYLEDFRFHSTDTLCALVKRLPDLEILNLDFVSKLDSTKLYAAVFSACPKLQKLVMKDMEYSCAAPRTLVVKGYYTWQSLLMDIVDHCPRSIVHLNAKECTKLKKPGMLSLIEYFHQSLQRLDLRNATELDNEILAAIAQKCAHLEYLNLYHCYKITEEAVAQLIKCCAKLKTMGLRSIDESVNSQYPSKLSSAFLSSVVASAGIHRVSDL